jgi:hypothetical protein
MELVDPTASAPIPRFFAFIVRSLGSMTPLFQLSIVVFSSIVDGAIAVPRFFFHCRWAPSIFRFHDTFISAFHPSPSLGSMELVDHTA